jgi:hypothetical protein
MASWKVFTLESASQTRLCCNIPDSDWQYGDRQETCFILGNLDNLNERIHSANKSLTSNRAWKNPSILVVLCCANRIFNLALPDGSVSRWTLLPDSRQCYSLLLMILSSSRTGKIRNQWQEVWSTGWNNAMSWLADVRGLKLSEIGRINGLAKWQDC